MTAQWLDGVVDAADYTVWRDTLGDAPSYAMPQPSAALLVALSSWAALVRRRRTPDHETLAT